MAVKILLRKMQVGFRLTEKIEGDLYDKNL